MRRREACAASFRVRDTPSYNMRLWNSGGANDISTLGVEVWECDICHHIQFFHTNPRS